MKLTMLRARIKETVGIFEGQVAKHDDYYEDVTTATDFYTVFCDGLRKYFDKVEIWYQENSEHPAGTFEHSTGLVERFCKTNYTDEGIIEDIGDVLFVRGNIDNYRPLLNRLRKTGAMYSIFLVYYSAGNYYCPPSEYDWNLVFVDDLEHLDLVEEKLDSTTELFKKSCVEKYFMPSGISFGRKPIDICFICNAPQYRLKRLDFFKEIMSGLKDRTAYVIGWKSDKLIGKFKNLPNVMFTGFIPRHHVSSIMNKCKIGLVLSNNKDGSPRVIQEFISCDMPVVISRGTTYSPLYINNQTGVSAVDDKMVEIIKKVLDKELVFKPRQYFLQELAMEKVVDYFAEKIKEQNSSILNP